MARFEFASKQLRRAVIAGVGVLAISAGLAGSSELRQTEAAPKPHCVHTADNLVLDQLQQEQVIAGDRGELLRIRRQLLPRTGAFLVDKLSADMHDGRVWSMHESETQRVVAAVARNLYEADHQQALSYVYEAANPDIRPGSIKFIVHGSQC